MKTNDKKTRKSLEFNLKRVKHAIKIFRNFLEATTKAIKDGAFSEL